MTLEDIISSSLFLATFAGVAVVKYQITKVKEENVLRDAKLKDQDASNLKMSTNLASLTKDIQFLKETQVNSNEFSIFKERLKHLEKTTEDIHTSIKEIKIDFKTFSDSINEKLNGKALISNKEISYIIESTVKKMNGG